MNYILLVGPPCRREPKMVTCFCWCC